MRPIWSALAFIAYVATTVLTADGDPPAWLGPYVTTDDSYLSARIINADLRLEVSIKKGDRGVILDITGAVRPSPDYEVDCACGENVGIRVEGQTACDVTLVTFAKLTPQAALLTVHFGKGERRSRSEAYPPRVELKTYIYDLQGEEGPYGAENRLMSFDVNFAIKEEGKPTLIYFKWLSALMAEHGLQRAGLWGDPQVRIRGYYTRPILLSTANFQAFIATWDAL